MQNFQQVNHSQINNSPTKYSYTFGNSSRFKQKSNNPICQNHSYFVDKTTNNKNNTYFNRQQRFKRSSYHQISPGPGPGHYQTAKSTSFDNKKNTFHNNINRSLSPQIRNQGPGPGAYNPNYDTIYNKGARNIKSIFIKPMINHEFRETIKSNKIGPGQYQLQKTDLSHNKIQYSKYKNFAKPIIGTQNRFKFYGIRSEIPGPGAYSYRDKINSGMKFSFGNDSKNQNIFHSNQHNQPGPAAYNHFSQFSTHKNRINHLLKRMDNIIKK